MFEVAALAIGADASTGLADTDAIDGRTTCEVLIAATVVGRPSVAKAAMGCANAVMEVASDKKKILDIRIPRQSENHCHFCPGQSKEGYRN